MPTKTETLLSSLKINKLTRSQFLTAKAADEVDLDNEFYMTGEVLGEGDMLKEVYDKDGDGIVDNAEKVNGLTVLTAVPANAKFTDTTYAVFKGATSSTGGGAGLVPAPTSGQSTRYLCSDGEWSIPTGSIYKGSTAISVKPSTVDGEYNIYLVALFPETTSQSVGPSASGTINFGSAFNVPHITIDQYGRITALANRSMILSGALASSSAPGLCPKLDSGHPSYYLNANGTWSAPRGRVYGVKGNAETAYREGQVNLTAANIGALPITGGTVSGATTFSDTVTLSTAGSITYDDGFYEG